MIREPNMKGCDNMEPLTNYKVTEQEIKDKGVQAVQGEVLYGEPAENKLIFDRLATFLIGKYNAALEWLVDKAHIHINKEILDTITSAANVHEHENKALLDTIEPDNVHAHANKAVLDTITAANVHLHTNKLLIDLINSSEQIHSHANKAFLDSLRETDIHSHENKSVIDTITQNMIAKWNQSAGIVDGNTDMDYGGFTGTFSKLQIRRGSSVDLPDLGDGEFGLADKVLYIGTESGNMQMADRAYTDDALKEKSDTSHKHTSKDVTDLHMTVLKIIYPVHTVLEFGANINPNTDITEWSGVDWTWERYAPGRVTVGYMEGDTAFGTLGAEGGDRDAAVVEHSHAQVAHTHTVGTESANHTHSVTGGAATTGANSANHTHAVTGGATMTGAAGSSGSNKNLQPYKVTAKWIRVA